MSRRSLEQCVDEKRCSLCELPDQPEDQFCYGCKSYVCDACSRNDTLMGSHDVVDHELTEDTDIAGER